MAFYKGDLVKRLIKSYPNCITVVEGTNTVDFEETAYNFSVAIMEHIDPKRQKYYFGQSFLSLEECTYYVRTYMESLLEDCQEFVDNNEEYYDDNL